LGPLLSAEKKQEILIALAHDPCATNVARAVGGVSVTTVWRLAQQEQMKLKRGSATGRRKRLSTQERRRIVLALERNPNAKAVAEKLGLASSTTVAKLAKQAEITLTAGEKARGKNHVSDETRAALTAKLKENPNARQVARELGSISHETVRKIAQSEGITLQRGTPVRKTPAPLPCPL